MYNKKNMYKLQFINNFIQLRDKTNVSQILLGRIKKKKSYKYKNLHFKMPLHVNSRFIEF